MWPPQKFCSVCFADTAPAWLEKKGKIIQYSKKDGIYFCLVEFGQIRLLCTLNSDVAPKTGQMMQFLRHKRQNGNDVFEIAKL